MESSITVEIITGILVVVANVATVGFFYGRLCNKVDNNTWKIGKLWDKVFNGRAHDHG